MDDRNINAFGDRIKKKGRGPGLKPRKVHLSLRLDKIVYDALMKRCGDAWRTDINDLLHKILVEGTIVDPRQKE